MSDISSYRPKKVLYVITTSNWGGAQRYVYDLATALPKEEYQVGVALGGDGLLKKKLDAAGIQTFTIGSLQRDVSFFKEFGALRELVSLFKREKPDIVHLNSSKAGGIGALAARIAGVPKIVFTAHGWPFWEQRNFLARALIWLASWATALLCHKIIVISDYDLKVAKKMPFVAHKATRIYNGIDLHLVLGAASMVRQSFPNGVRITGTIGELINNKNQIALIEQAKNNPDMYVAIVGDGEKRAYLMQKIEEYGLRDRVKIMGFHWASEVLGGFDVFALPSIKEGLPYVLLEAKAAGLPIVANRVGGVGEILDAKDMTQFSLERMVAETRKVYTPL